MKNSTIMRGYTGLHAFFPTTAKNVQEIEPTHSISIAGSERVDAPTRARVLSKRNARHARRLAH